MEGEDLSLERGVRFPLHGTKSSKYEVQTVIPTCALTVHTQEEDESQ